MRSRLVIFITFMLFASCESRNQEMNDKKKFLVNDIPSNLPLQFKPGLTPNNMLVHRGVFSRDFSHYYYTISDKDFKQFDTKFIKKVKGKWSQPKDAFFNSTYSDHGMSFSPDGNSLYFSSTRPTNIENIPDTWHIWKAKNIYGEWSEPEFIDIPNLRGKLVSHPSISNSGTIYFHASNLDYTDMGIYSSKQVNGKFQDAKKVIIKGGSHTNKCTSYISPDESYLIYASVENQLNLNITYRGKEGKWSSAKKLNQAINTNGQGNPTMTPDGKFLFYASAEKDSQNWSVNWVKMESIFN